MKSGLSHAPGRGFRTLGSVRHLTGVIGLAGNDAVPAGVVSNETLDGGL